MRAKRIIDLDKSDCDVRGPTEERLQKAQGAFVLGGEDRGVRVYFFADTPLQRLYARLRLRASKDEAEELTLEHVALKKYAHHWYHAGREASLPSVDLNRLGCSDPSTRHGMAMGDKQIDHQKKYREAVAEIGWQPHILLENFCCQDHPLHISAMTIGYSEFRARRLVRDSAAKLVRLWGIG